MLTRLMLPIKQAKSLNCSTIRFISQVRLTPNMKTSVDVGNTNAIEGNKRVDARFMKKFPRSSTYDPFDFSLARLHLEKKFGSTKQSKNDMFDKYGINPLDLYTSPEVLSQFMSSTGKILHRDVTGLSAKNQRRLSKSIRRAQAIGLLSKTHKDVSFLPTRTSGKL
ncbi:hypothetical protein HG535_0F03560 [Zygotorulaspora mrakii]|uniref:Small ribosomal subunit protein bS18m n=1 Tax=Zygotorulaspora mrakii TaxID=42260 RepID=A0A7H9B590_ZYGMR|nr:uncharacterized protein HG535_0F03560 [Zygotorulaspora mrakii]QLG73845.1 hypothetical protein HG535_0F03560 [Zygotorulaspora mrakii]